MNFRDGDEEGPPELVDVDALEEETAAKSPTERKFKKVPITIVTGYLGAGKTTLLNYILGEEHGKKIAVILNEFGDSIDIEKSLTVNKDGQQVEEWLELANGCICCSVRDTGVVAIESLMERQGTFDYILLETTGLADPGNIAPLFWVDDGLGSTIYLDGIVTLVDGKNILRLLDEPAPAEVQGTHHGAVLTTAHLQISHADVIILNKSDLLTAAELDKVKERVISINGLAKIIVTDHSKVPNLEGTVLELHAYDNVTDVDFSEKGHSHLDPSISTLSFTIDKITPECVPKVDAWLRSLLWERQLPPTNQGQQKIEDFEIHRLKGLLCLTDGSTQVIQGVQEVFDITETDSRHPSASGNHCKMVLIGRGLGMDSSPWRESLQASLGRAS
ncbi:CobW domain-containing protein [Blastomyces gilchristii SLH14081]|uniref:CobW domain-containing protein n=1 Tax=Blastomyces gilchristii (strain SLH14081) TaxID=559298 RepID=A0A179UBY5_BLAGS|nr:CobW domain-containing protein [Blastomyces gilchristii SLH14081]OAT04042.1 CobW domain-containing protein [Blastomyces gilchristii SLH14081]